MFFVDDAPAEQGRRRSFASHATDPHIQISYYFKTVPGTADRALHAKLDRVLALLKGKPYTEPDELVGTMSTREAASFIAISKRTFERLVSQGMIKPLPIKAKGSYFAKKDVVQCYIRYHRKQPPKMP